MSIFLLYNVDSLKFVINLIIMDYRKQEFGNIKIRLNFNNDKVFVRRNYIDFII